MNTKHQRGAQAVEFALVLPFFLVLLLLIIDFGFLTYNKAVITNASREAARKGTVLTGTTWTAAAVESVACQYIGTSLITTHGTHTPDCKGTSDPIIKATSSSSPPTFGGSITVTVNYTYQGFLTSFMGTTIESPWLLKATSTMNHE
jgi:Flp pilus assembly protein TadG